MTRRSLNEAVYVTFLGSVNFFGSQLLERAETPYFFLIPLKPSRVVTGDLFRYEGPPNLSCWGPGLPTAPSRLLRSKEGASCPEGFNVVLTSNYFGQWHSLLVDLGGHTIRL